MSASDFEYIVVGGGAMGTSTAYYLARDKKSVLLLEQFDTGHDRGSSHGESRIIRLSYWNRVYIKLAIEAYREWADIESDSSRQLIWKTGGLDLGTTETKSFEFRLAGLQDENIEHEYIDAAEIRVRYPQFHVSNNTLGIVQEDAGIVQADWAIDAMATCAKKHGAVIRDKTPVISLNLRDDGADVVTEDKTYSCKKLVITAGAWIGPMLGRLGVELPLTVTHEQFAFFKASKPELFTIGKFPVFIHLRPDPTTNASSVYGFPAFQQEGVKVAEECIPPVHTTADTRSFDIDQTRLKELSKYVSKFLPDAYGEVVHAKTCLYTRSPDDHFIIDSLPGYAHVTVGSICSGHGFKFASIMGRILADLAERHQTKYPIDLFKIDRFSKSPDEYVRGKWK